MTKKHAVFTYGSLKRGYWNNRRLGDSEFLGEAVTAVPFYLADYVFPYACRGGPEKMPVRGEVFLVDDRTLASLDRLEGTPHHYQRSTVTVVMADGTPRCAHIYSREDPRGLPSCPVVDGCYVWSPREDQR